MIALFAAFRIEVRAILDEIAPSVPSQFGTILCFRGQYPPQNDVVVVLSGPGQARAAAAAQVVIPEFKPSLILSIGTCGSLSLDLDAGHVVVPRRVQTVCLGGEDLLPEDPIEVDSELQQALVTARARAGIPGQEGTLLSADRVVRTIPEKKALSEIQGVKAVDMESAAIARVAIARGVPFAAARVVLDKMWEEIHVDYMRITAGRPIPSFWDFFAYLVFRPGKWKYVYRDARRTFIAAKRLQSLLRSFLRPRDLYA